MSLEKYRAKRSAERTPEPFGGQGGRPRLFVVQKHAARRLHYDFRLEWGGVLRSWAVPHGPSLDPSDKRLAVEVEDHPVEYADFEGIIPAGNYGAGEVIVWDRGRWSPLQDMEEGFRKGKLLFDLKGYKLRGVWTLVRIQPKGARGSRARETSKEWLLIKERDAWARRGPDGALPQESILSGLALEELREAGARAEEIRRDLERLGAPRRIVRGQEAKAMLAQLREKPFTAPGWIWELKYDGYRVMAAREEGGARFIYRSGLDATAIFPDIARALRALPFDRLVMDGEIVVHDEASRPSFQRLQKRALLQRQSDIEQAAVELPAALYVFDLLGFEDFDLRPLPLLARKAILRRVLPRTGPLRFADHVEERGEDLCREVEAMRLEGVVGKRAESSYKAGRSEDWVKVRLERTGDFAVVGFTEPRGSRSGFGSLHLAVCNGEGTLGVPDDEDFQEGTTTAGPAATPRASKATSSRSRGGTRSSGATPRRSAATTKARSKDGTSRAVSTLVYAGRVGTGFTQKQLEEVRARLATARCEEPRCIGPIPPDRDTTWVEPQIVCEVRFHEWTDKGLLRKPVFLRFRTDKPIESCIREGGPGSLRDSPLPASGTKLEPGPLSRFRKRVAEAAPDRANGRAVRRAAKQGEKQAPDWAPRGAASEGRRQANAAALHKTVSRGGKQAADDRSRRRLSSAPATQPANRTDVERRVPFSNLDKVFWPEEGYTKGALLDYYRDISPWLLPYLRDRPIVMTRYPDGIKGKSFFQKDAPSFAPGWVRTERVWSEFASREIDYFVCDDVESLLYVVNLGSIPLHVWSSRVASLEKPDWCILDLDPKGASFTHVVRVARAIHDLCDEIALPSFIKTSGATGLHVLLPLGCQCTYIESRSLGEILARVIERRLPEISTTARPIGARGGRVYLDFLQNGHGRTIAGPFSARPLPGATVSTPLTWKEVSAKLDPGRFTLLTAPTRMRRLRKDPLREVLTSKPDLGRALERLMRLLRK